VTCVSRKGLRVVHDAVKKPRQKTRANATIIRIFASPCLRSLPTHVCSLYR
jgi:hypothetical protein